MSYQSIYRGLNKQASAQQIRKLASLLKQAVNPTQRSRHQAKRRRIQFGSKNGGSTTASGGPANPTLPNAEPISASEAINRGKLRVQVPPKAATVAGSRTTTTRKPLVGPTLPNAEPISASEAINRGKLRVQVPPKAATAGKGLLKRIKLRGKPWKSLLALSLFGSGALAGYAGGHSGYNSLIEQSNDFKTRLDTTTKKLSESQAKLAKQNQGSWSNVWDAFLRWLNNLFTPSSTTSKK